MSIPVCDRVLVWIDTETTGLDPNKHEIIEFAGIKGEESLHLKLWPEHLETASEQALALNGYSVDVWEQEGALTQREGIPRIARFIGPDILAGQNVSFDEKFLIAAMERYGEDLKIGHHKLDTVTLAIVYLCPLGMRSVSLGPVCEILGISNEGEHTALADVLRARAVYEALRFPREIDLALWHDRIVERNRLEDIAMFLGDKKQEA